MKAHLKLSIILGSILLINTNAQAGLYTDDLSRCLVESTSTADKVSLVKWMFTAAAFHPAVSSIASVSEKQLVNTNKEIAELFTKLLTESCKEQSKKAFKNEGQIAIQAGFQVLGQVAGRELFSSPEVSAGMAGLKKYFDNKKLEEVFGGPN